MVERLIVIIEPMVHGESATMERMTVWEMENGEERRLSNRNSQSVKDGGDLPRQEGTNTSTKKTIYY